MSLVEFQQGFIKQLSEKQRPHSFLKYLKACGELQPEKQLAIYQNNVRGALQNSLSQTYPICEKILGSTYFRQLAKKYITVHPSRNSNLSHYGENFSGFIDSCLKTRKELADYAYLGDLAMLEWHYQQAYSADESPVFDFDSFAQLSPDQQGEVYFDLANDFALLNSDYPIVSIWRLNNQETDEGVEINQCSEKLCVYREQFEVKVLCLEADAFQLLTKIMQGSRLAELVELDKNNLLLSFIKSGWICSHRVNHV